MIETRATRRGGDVQSVTLEGRRFVILPEDEYCRLSGEPPEPEMPAPDAAGNYPAAEAMQVSIARSIIRDRRRLGLSQVELSRRAGIRHETLNRIERGANMPSIASIDKIDRALKQAEAAAGKGRRVTGRPVKGKPVKAGKATRKANRAG